MLLNGMSGTQKTIIIGGVLLVLVGGVTTISLLLTREHRKQRRNEKKLDKIEGFDGEYWVSHQNSLNGLTNSKANKYAEKIYNAIGVFSNDYTAISGVFEQLENQAQLSLVSSEFFSKYGKSLKEFLEDELKDSDYNEVCTSLLKLK